MASDEEPMIRGHPWPSVDDPGRGERLAGRVGVRRAAARAVRHDDAILGEERGGNGRYDDIVEPVAESRASRHRAGSQPATASATATAGVAQRSREAGPRPGSVLAMPRELRNHLQVGAIALTLAFVALMFAYYRAADVSESRPAFTATAWGATVLAVAGIVATIGMVGMRRRLMYRRRTLLSGFVAARRGPEDGGTAEPVLTRMPERLLVIPQGRYAHVPSCAMVRGERTEPVNSAALPEGILPCAICTPAAL